MLPVRLTAQQKQSAIGAILVAMKKPKNFAYEVADLAQALSALSVRLTGEHTEQAVTPILAAMTKADISAHDLQSLARALMALPATLTDEQTTGVAEPFLAAIKRSGSEETRVYELPELAKAFQPLPFKFTPEHGKSAADLVLAALKGSPTRASEIAETLEALAPHFNTDEARELLQVARASLAMVSQADNRGYVDENALDAWAGAIAALASNDPDDKAFLATIVEVLKYPTAVGKPTETLLAALRQRFPNTPELKGDLQTAAPWFEKQLGADVVVRPAQRPN